jgi:hypothetical protein
VLCGETLNSLKNLPIFKISPKSGRPIIDILYDKIRVLHCTHPVCLLTRSDEQKQHSHGSAELSWLSIQATTVFLCNLTNELNLCVRPPSKIWTLKLSALTLHKVRVSKTSLMLVGVLCEAPHVL